jgi:predicted amidohydrolase YtcJ
MRSGLLLILTCCVAACGHAGTAAVPPDGPAEIVFTGGVVWTGVPGAAPATAVAVLGNRIVAVGSDEAMADRIGDGTRVVQLNGRMLLPGFIDDHTHFLSGGFQLASVDLRDAATPAAFAARIGEFAGTLPAGRWVTGGDWDHEVWPGAPLPHREWIDAVTTEHPVAVNRLDGHMLLANSLALRLAGITRDTPDPPGGTIVRDPRTGEPTGVLKDEAMQLVYGLVPEPTDAERDEALLRAQRHALERGVTMVHDMGSWQDLDTYRRAHGRGALSMRVYALVPLGAWERLRDHVAQHGRGDDLLQWGGLKGFVDGSLGSTTAWFHAPYVDEPSHSGLVVTDTSDLRRWITGADAAGLHVVVHAIGDRANAWLLDTYAGVARRNGARDRRFRIEHAQHLAPADIARFADLAVLPSMQPYHAVDDGRWAEKRIGARRAETTYAFRSLLDAGASLMFGSDWTVAPLDPLLGIHAAVTRRTIDGANPGGWVPSQKIGVEEALRAYTAANAYGAFMEDRLGTMAPGMLADLVVLSEDLLRIDPVRIPEVRVDMTVMDGRIVYERQ